MIEIECQSCGEIIEADDNQVIFCLCGALLSTDQDDNSDGEP